MNRMILAAALVLPLASPATAQDRQIDLQALEKEVQAILPKVRACTVKVGGSGSGVVVSKDGLILSCAHVTQKPGRTIQITFPDGRRVTATSLGHFHEADASLLRINRKGEYPFVEMAEADEVSVGDWVLAVGYPLSFRPPQLPPVRIGRVSRTARNAVISDAPIMGGDSGGPLFNLDGKVVGISSRVSPNIVANVHVPIALYRESWKRLLDSESWGRGPGSRANRQQRRSNSESRRGSPPEPDVAKSSDKQSTPDAKVVAAGAFKSIGVSLKQTAKGVLVSGVMGGSLAERSGVRTGHIIRKVGDTEVKDIATCEAALKQAKSKYKVMLMVTRQDAAHAKVTLGLMMKDKVTR